MNRIAAAVSAGVLGSAAVVVAGSLALARAQGRQQQGQEQQRTEEQQRDRTQQEGRMEDQQRRQQQTGQRQEGRQKGQQANAAEQMIRRWPKESQQAARAMIEKYGEPNVSNERMLVWYDNGPWKRTVVHREAVEHNFPRPHRAALEQAVNQSVPVEKVGDLARFSGSIIVDRNKGELISRHEREEGNFVALNLANDIIEDEKSVEEARSFFGRTMREIQAGRSSEYAQKLLFKGKRNSGDPGEKMGEEMLRE